MPGAAVFLSSILRHFLRNEKTQTYRGAY